MEMYDVCVVGQGPGGGMAALELARAGHKVLAIDRKQEVGQPIHCGEGLGHIALEHTGLKLDDSWHQTTVEGNRIYMPNGKYVGLMGTGYTIDRHLFDKHLSDLAVEAGVERHTGLKVDKVHHRSRGMGSRENFWLVQTSLEEYKARQVIVAEGRQPMVVTQVGLKGNEKETLLPGLQYKFSPGDIELPNEPYLDFYLTADIPNGYAWVFPRRDDINVGICCDGDMKASLKNFCRNFLKVDPEKKLSQNGGLIPRAGPIPNFSVPGAYVVGDAAGLTNPITKGGIHVALLSAQIAVHACRLALEGPSSDSVIPPHAIETRKAARMNAFLPEDTEPHTWYEKVLRAQAYCDPKFIEESKLIYTLPLEVMNHIGDIYDGNNYDKLPWGRMLKVLAKNPSLIPMATKLLKIKANFKITEQYGW